ncbi:uroporphyrinogen-III synthase [Kocuria rhizophila]|uniref:uroporphyrinogen-III synthase n=1 Tax=Kocuria rhizophila TaxID=72000 RepID=UPI001CB9952D|nr:uroporphyrinogen-III synthase [Kocuria rhizophila]MCT1957955.1 uroporphyrinogen-III synthase [Kocuria rhizophila]MCT2073908.1 uroporphyrinogen-III synthase [Kocuria rhizophila]
MLVTRDPAAARPLAALLRERGYEPCTVRLLEASLPLDTEPLREMLREATLPRVPTWLCLTSATAVHALAAVADSPDWGAQLDAARSAPLRIAAVGAATARALAEHGVGVDFVPAETSSAVGMLEEWPERIEEPGLEGRRPPAASGAPRALLPVSALASDTLEHGLRSKGYRVLRARAYDMVPAPAARPLSTVAPEPDDAPELDHAAARAACASGELAAVVVTAPSRAGQLLDGCRPAEDTAWIAIGEPTARALRERGLTPVTAGQPTPEALADAVVHALGTPGTAGRNDFS